MSKKMTKLEAILNGLASTEKLFELRKKEILRKIEAAKDEQESLKAKAELTSEKVMLALADEEVDYDYVLNKLLEQKQIIIDSNDTLKALNEIEAELKAEIE